MMPFYDTSFKSITALLSFFPQFSHSFYGGSNAEFYQLPALLGPAFPIPVNLSENSDINAATTKFLSLVQNALDTGNSSHGAFDNSSTSFSFSFYSANDESPIYEYHHSSPILTNITSGVKKIDRDTVYRVGSISKLLTVYSFLVFTGDIYFNEPITRYVPELLGASNDTTNNDPVHRTAWSDITIGALASHMAGIGTDYGALDMARLNFPFAEIGFPHYRPTKSHYVDRPLLVHRVLGKVYFLKGIALRDPVVATFQTPIYSNAAFQILSYALEQISGEDFSSIFHNTLIEPLNLSHTSYNKPNDSLGVVPGDETATFWNYDLGDLWPSGGVYSSTGDLGTIGRSILNSTLPSGAQTRRWMKPVAHTASLTTSIGAPWEIQRTKLDDSGRIVDLYTKDGKLGSYGSYMILIPDYNVGFTILVAGASSDADVLAGFVTDAFLPALEAAAKTQADSLYSAVYQIPVNKTVGANSSNTMLKISTHDSIPGLVLKMWSSSGTFVPSLFPLLETLGTGDVNDSIQTLENMQAGQAQIDINSVSITLFPTGLKSSTPDGGEVISFRGVFGINSTTVDTSPFADPDAAWEIADQFIYGNSGLDEFFITLDKNGEVVSIENALLQQKLVKVSGLGIYN
ncbi:hypothetical protein G7Y89_g8558 [Cudoniella acicularis]|uniref:Beta-lactamase-related domain-containing protein n=1 Tax=Cudoniella acicularis TaxID=354080 RepID=A0A8H4RJ59_9HELO|nr:hypothetical protein G7Y89_g8558 [Cudoniella acicularis]